MKSPFKHIILGLYNSVNKMKRKKGYPQKYQIKYSNI